MHSRVITLGQFKKACSSVVDAIDQLHDKGVYRDILDSLGSAVVPLWFAYHFPPDKNQKPFASYRLHVQRHENARKALIQWAKRYHLIRVTGRNPSELRRLAAYGLIDEDDATPEQPVEWALNWGMTICDRLVRAKIARFERAYTR